MRITLSIYLVLLLLCHFVDQDKFQSVYSFIVLTSGGTIPVQEFNIFSNGGSSFFARGKKPIHC